MTTFDAGPFTLEKVRDYVWELPKEGDMRVPARVLASEALLAEIAEDKTLEQLRNTTHLPGIQKYAVCMPDGHQGYGFPVGGVAGIDADEGCISPGAVGYDINCLSGSTDVLLEFGRRCPIERLKQSFEDERAVIAAEDSTTSSIRLFTETPDQQVYEVTTATGRTIEATEDHPVVTPEGDVEVGDLDPGDVVYVHPFDGLPDERPPETTFLDESDFADADPQLRDALRERGLLPLSASDDAFNRLLKLVGFHTGDGSFRGEQTWFYGDPEDLRAIAEDIEALGFTPSRIFDRDREHEINGREFENTEYSVRSTSKAFKELLLALGAPEPPKVDSAFTTPEYLDELPGWQRALYLSAFFGAEMSAPATMAPKNFYAPSVSHNRLADHEAAGERFLRELKHHLETLDVETNAVERVEETETEAGTSVRLRFGVSSRAANLVRFLTTVGYRYSRSKQTRGLLAAEYLELKQHEIEQRARAAEQARCLADGGLPPRDVKDRVDGVNDRFVERSIYGQRAGTPRPPADFPTFEEFRADRSVRHGIAVEAEVVGVEPAGRATVYDIGVDHEAHNFAANGLIVSNCGVRMVRTDLTYDDLQGRETELVEALFANVPSGLGGGGVFEGSVSDVESILDRGLDWALEHDYAVPDDLAHCEDEGRRPEADPSAVSDEAKERGSTQVGSLGSGNHFLEVQRVTDVYLDDVAAEFGLRPDQVVVLIHCGSRGLGHQVCTDYLREIEQTHAGLLERLPDKELAAAPAGSHLADAYYGAMCAAINFAWVNRQLITHQTRRVFERVFDDDWESLGMELLYDVAHNIAKKEVHTVDGEDRELFIHRKGATRAFPAGRPEVPRAYRDVGQPVIIPGSMGTGSYVLRGGDASLSETFGSTAHGAGRLMSRTQAKNEFWGEDVVDDLRDRNQVYVKAQSGATVAEEAPGVYKDVDEVVRVSDALGIGDTVARTFPVCNIKG